MDALLEIEGFTIYKYKVDEAKVIGPDNKEFFIKFQDYRKKINCEDYGTRYEYKMALVDLLPDELPYKVRMFLIFSY